MTTLRLSTIATAALLSVLASPSVAQGKIHWATSLANALAEAKEQSTVVMITINMPGERGSDAMQPVYKDARIFELSRATINLYFPVGPEGSHSADERTIRERYLGAKPEDWVTAPTHLFVKPEGEGELLSSVSYQVTRGQLEWMWQDAIKKVKPDFLWELAEDARAPERLLFGDADATSQEPPTPEQVEATLKRLKQGNAKFSRGGWRKLIEDFNTILRSDETSAIKYATNSMRTYRRFNRTTLDTIGKVSPKKWWKVAAEYADDRRDDVRAAAARTLGKLHEKKALSTLKKRWRKEKIVAVQGDILPAMATLGPEDRTVISTLKKVLDKSKESSLRLRAAVAASYLENRSKVTELLSKALGDDSDDVRSAAAYAIASRRDKELLKTLEDAASKERAPETKKWMTLGVEVVKGGDLRGFSDFVKKHLETETEEQDWRKLFGGGAGRGDGKGDGKGDGEGDDRGGKKKE